MFAQVLGTCRYIPMDIQYMFKILPRAGAMFAFVTAYCSEIWILAKAASIHFKEVRTKVAYFI